MFLLLLAHGPGCRSASARQGRNIGRRKGRRCSQQVFQHPFGARCGRSPGGIRGENQNAELSQDSTPRRARERDLPEVRTGHVRDAVIVSYCTSVFVIGSPSFTDRKSVV